MALKLTMTCGPYDRVRALIDGTVKPDGIELEVHVNPDNPGRRTEGPSGATPRRFEPEELFHPSTLGT